VERQNKLKIMAYKPTEEQKKAAAEKYAELCATSELVKFLMSFGAIQSETVNAGLIEYYRNTHNLPTGEFNTFNQWKALGAFPAKLSKGFAVWSAPIKPKEDAPKAAEGETKKDFSGFVVCYLFHESQVEYKGEKPAPTKTTEPETETTESPTFQTETAFVYPKALKERLELIRNPPQPTEPKHQKGSVESFFFD
jgi:hypothetical protein